MQMKMKTKENKNTGENMKRVEFLYDKRLDKTQIFIWDGMRLVDTREVNGITTQYIEKKIKKEIMEEGWEK